MTFMFGDGMCGVEPWPPVLSCTAPASVKIQCRSMSSHKYSFTFNIESKTTPY